MATSQTELEKELEQLISTKYPLHPKQFSTEERAVLQTLTKLAYVYAQPDGQTSLVSTVPIASIENIIQSGQLTLVAEKLDDSFLESIEKIIASKHIKFTAEAEGMKIVTDMTSLYQRCCRSLPKNASFENVLFKMYTEESAFYRKMNAIIGGYNDPAKTTDDEKIFALLLNIALHKAGLKKANNEMQEIPETLYRGQSVGLEDIKKKFDMVNSMKSSDTLANVAPKDLQDINIASVVRKKNVSTSKDEDISTQFAKGTAGNKKGIVLKIQNPAEIADFYNIANVSGTPKEAEFSSRFPDDVAIIPVHLEEDVNGVTHVEAVCIRSDKVILENSQHLDSIVNSIKSKMNNILDDEFLDQDQKNLLLPLASKFYANPDANLLEFTVKTLQDLYQTNPDDSLKADFDDLKRSLEAYFAITADLKVSHNQPKTLENEQKNMQKILQGKNTWFSEANIPDNHVLSAHFKVLSNPSSTNEELHGAARNIKAAIKLDKTLTTQYPQLEQGMKDLMSSINTIQKLGKDNEFAEDETQSLRF
ncbi:hypothetical protein BN59_03645 [Legionella massiliensis]|uniref:Uncharacterized protein n=1 Tax=Legionella massiliensis TaxID=1034943 RepID=A0A078L274_9GAMM|nr:hypothetical protein [Legionella massiliensis]CDZ79327.1 hypothetical protein BN59_03645 [Legionella massiliensis]CEE15065.1 hypothetical protein BN1094_03645 [Legionella massiliensis]